MVEFLLHDENLIFSLFATFPPVVDAIKINEKFEIHFSPSCNQYNMMRYWPHWTNNQIICDWQNVLSYLFWILFFTIASISVFFFLFSYMNKEHIKRSTSYTNTNQIKSHSYYKIKPTAMKRFFITDHHHTYVYTLLLAILFVRILFYVCKSMVLGSWWVVVYEHICLHFFW